MKYLSVIALLIIFNCIKVESNSDKMNREKQLNKLSDKRMSEVDRNNFEKNFVTVDIHNLLQGTNSFEDIKHPKIIPYPLVKQFLEAPVDKKLTSIIYEFRNKSYINDSICLMVYKMTYQKFDEVEILITYDIKKQKSIDTLTISKYDYHNNIFVSSVLDAKTLRIKKTIKDESRKLNTSNSSKGSYEEEIKINNTFRFEK
ncbi:hypothetical protein SAMN05421846_104228 [Chryseobacterium taeanense]|uniref:Uncharacterized protein n=1 Tax=Chryseobacterium taeanense TaxID=311334 RepID=A0A1G8I6I7_9FLAO|nr:hypothetical protein [Chryseobacterium taeanense]SDI14432.1 hypothetical protein SAMN05421846_104228 [Chryseobacterium taeanense]